MAEALEPLSPKKDRHAREEISAATDVKALPRETEENVQALTETVKDQLLVETVIAAEPQLAELQVRKKGGSREVNSTLLNLGELNCYGRAKPTHPQSIVFLRKIYTQKKCGSF